MQHEPIYVYVQVQVRFRFANRHKIEFGVLQMLQDDRLRIDGERSSMSRCQSDKEGVEYLL